MWLQTLPNGLPTSATGIIYTVAHYSAGAACLKCNIVHCPMHTRYALVPKHLLIAQWLLHHTPVYGRNL